MWVAAAAAALATLPTAAGAPAVCGPLAEVRAGTVRAPDAVELSGVVVSRRQPGVLFTHNDSGDSARIFALRADGRLIGSIRVPGAVNVDWEDIALGPGRDGRPALYLGDIGDNARRRAGIDVYRVPEPEVGRGAPAATAPAERLGLQYPGGPRDAEALLVDPRGGDLYVVTKRLDGRSEVFRARAPLPFGGTAALEPVGALRLGLPAAVTGGDVSAAGDVIVLRTYGSVFSWGRTPGESVARALARPPCRAPAHVVAERQGEAIGLLPDGRGFVTLSEGVRSPIWRYTARAGPS